MASVIVTFRVMPTGTDTDLDALEGGCLDILRKSGAMSTKVEKEPIAFGLTALKILFVMDESRGDTEPIEKQIHALDGVENVEVTDVRRTFG